VNTKQKKTCEVLVSTVIVSVTTVTLFWVFAIIRNWHGQTGVGSLLLGFFYGIVMGLLTMGVFIIPSAFLVSLAMVSLKRWSLSAVAVLFLLVVICSSVSSYLIDPTQSQAQHGSEGYFTRLDWFASEFTLTAIITGFIASLIAFWVVLRYRRRHETVA
jgi:hypothetical protein